MTLWLRMQNRLPLITMMAGSLERLRAWMEAEGLKVMWPPVSGYFDPAWTPAFLRRNEVMLRTETAEPSACQSKLKP